MHPMLWLGALGLALPILAHLLNKHQYKETQWAAMQFLNKAVRVRSRQIRLRDLILLILRCLALLLLVFALTRPSLQRGDFTAAIEGESRAAVIIALDASYSMLHSDGTNTRFERAVQEIDSICEHINPGDPVSLILLGGEHRVVLRDMAYERERFAAVLHDQHARPEQLKLDRVPEALANLARDAKAIQKEVYIVTDLQARDWQASSSTRLHDSLAALNGLAQTYILPVQGSDDNVCVTNLELLSGVLRQGTTARYSATVRNTGRRPVTNVRVKCVMDGINVDSKTIPLIAGGASETVSFFVPFHNSGAARITAELDSDALAIDNVRGTVANIRQRVSILCVEGKSSGTESFITQALQARGGDSDKEDFRVRTVSWLSLPAQNLANFDIVILSDVPEVTPEQAVQLRDYVKAGSGLIWFGGENVKPALWNTRSEVAKDSFLLPATLGDAERVSDESGAGRPLDPVRPDHPICRPLRSLPKDLLSETRFDRLLTAKPLASGRTVLSLSGNDSPVLIEHSIGRGHVFMFTTSATPAWNTMALTPVFPMLLQQMVTYLTGREFERPQLVGNSLSLSYADRPDANDGVFDTPSGESITVPVRQHGSQYVAVLEHAEESGFYVARVSVQSPGVPIAVNVDTSESDVRCLDPGEAQASLTDSGVVIAQSANDLMDSVQTARAGFEYWRLLLAAALVFLVVESLVAAKLFRRAK